MLKPNTLKLYRRSFDLFVVWRGSERNRLPRSCSNDVVLATYLTFLFLKGHGTDEGKRAIYGWNHFEGHFHRVLDACPRTARALKGWSRKEPGEVRDGLPEEAVNLLAEDLIAHGETDAALCVLVLFDSYLRVSELSFLRREHVFAPSSLASRSSEWVMEAFPSLWGDEDCPPRTSKTHDEDVCVSLDSKSRRTSILALSIAYKRCKRNELLFKTSPERLRTLMHESGKRTNLVGMKPSPHRLRHGGASSDFAQHRRSLKEIQLRGHWRSWASVRRYSKPASLLKQWTKVPNQTKLKANGSESRLMALLRKL